MTLMHVDSSPQMCQMVRAYANHDAAQMMDRIALETTNCGPLWLPQRVYDLCDMCFDAQLRDDYHSHLECILVQMFAVELSQFEEADDEGRSGRATGDHPWLVHVRASFLLPCLRAST